MNNADAIEWSEIRQAANVIGYLTVEETERHLQQLLG
jgi:hypothetical protein